jgi:threonine synthase
VPECILECLQLRKLLVDSISVGDEMITHSIAHCYMQHEYYLCPHTATAYAYTLKMPSAGCVRGRAHLVYLMQTASDYRHSVMSEIH